ncbi:T-cell immunomodulatory protein isoform X2 [Hippopotamus amphibius kiboko]|uniref:T-cell immunomodulatory protein isoform X2 n=1 Tax=Hippopotamus amphibius kiboko TaxID=575201 RepID=UPI0025991DED|nr:T-cell immunomodulatory protein isoform X2 [Hippopotamus amphibius kiboko]
MAAAAAAAGRLPGCWVLLAPLLGGLALLGVGPVPVRALHNVTAELFGAEAWGTLAAFGDLNSDKQTDLFVLRERNDLIVFLADQTAPYFKPKVNISLNNYSTLITSVVPGDYDGDSQMDVLLTYLPQNLASGELGAVIFWGQNQTLDSSNMTILNRTFQDEPLIMDFNGDLIPDIFGITNESSQPQILLGGNLSWHAALTTKNKMRIPHSHAFIDLTEDFTADLFLTTLSASGTFQFEIWENLDGNFSASTVLEKPQSMMVVGQSAFADFDGDGNMDHLLPGCEDKNCQKSAIYLARSRTKQWIPVLQDFSNKGTLWGFVPFVHEQQPPEIPIPITLHIGDYNMDGYPDALAILKNTSGSNQQAFLLENVPCNNASCEGAHRMFKVYWELMDLNQIRNAVVATFFDIYEDGILDIIVLSKGYTKNDFAIHTLKNNFEADAYFVKVIVLSGLCPNECPRKITMSHHHFWPDWSHLSHPSKSNQSDLSKISGCPLPLRNGSNFVCRVQASVYLFSLIPCCSSSHPLSALCQAHCTTCSVCSLILHFIPLL